MTTTYYLRFDTGTLSSDKVNGSKHCVEFECSNSRDIYESPDISNPLHIFFPKVIRAILHDSVVICNYPCFMMLVRSSSMFNLSNVHVDNLAHLAELAIRSFASMRFKVGRNVNDFACKALAKRQSTFIQLLQPTWSQALCNAVCDFENSIYCMFAESLFLLSASHVVCPIFSQHQAELLKTFLQSHPNIIGISFESNICRLKKLETEMIVNLCDLLAVAPQLKHLAIDNNFVQVCITRPLELPFLNSLIIRVRREDELALFFKYINGLPSLRYLNVQCAGSVSWGLADQLVDIISDNYTLLGVELPSQYGQDVVKAKDFLQRNAELEWKNVHRRVLDFCIALSPLELPPYVLLEIFDWLPMEKKAKYGNISLMFRASHWKKIHLIMAIRDSIQKIVTK